MIVSEEKLQEKIRKLQEEIDKHYDRLRYMEEDHKVRLTLADEERRKRDTEEALYLQWHIERSARLQNELISEEETEKETKNSKSAVSLFCLLYL